jgi:hypothetical protein
MKDEQIKIGIEQIQKIKMTTEEKDLVLKNILSFPISIEKPVASPYSNSFFSIFQRHHFAYYSMATFLILVLSGGGVAFASQESLPGNILYPIKVSIVEPINSALKFKVEDKAKYESKLATTRMIEAETLAYQGKLDTEKEAQINTLLATHTSSLDKAINELEQGQSNEKAYEIASNFKAEMSAHAKVLDIINEQNNATVSTSVTTNIDIKEEQKTEGMQVSTAARINASKITTSSKDIKEEETEETKNEYAAKKQTIETMMSSTTTDLNQTTATSPIKQKIIDNTRKNLEESNQLLNNANEQDKNGDAVGAYSSLLDSESSLKEADILLRTSSQIKESTRENKE